MSGRLLKEELSRSLGYSRFRLRLLRLVDFEDALQLRLGGSEVKDEEVASEDLQLVILELLDGSQDLLDACELGRVKHLEALLLRPEAPLAQGLEVSASKGHSGCVQLLLEARASYGRALHLAAARGHAKAAELLLEARAEVNATERLVDVGFGGALKAFKGERSCGRALKQGLVLLRCTWPRRKGSWRPWRSCWRMGRRWIGSRPRAIARCTWQRLTATAPWHIYCSKRVRRGASERWMGARRCTWHALGIRS